MSWLKKFAERLAHWCLRKARECPDIPSKEFERWKQDYKKDFGKDFK